MNINALISLAKRGSCEKMIEVSSAALALDLEVSQQTASRRIKELEKEGYIARETLPRGQRIKISRKGTAELRQVYSDLSRVFRKGGKGIFMISGEIISGTGDGGYYMGIASYRKQFTEKLGFEPYPGTLNIKLKTEDDIRTRQELQELGGIRIEGFTHENRTFGSVKCFRAEIDGVKGAVVIPERTHHGFNLIEAVSTQKIREKLGLKDGDIVSVRIFVG